MKKFYRAVTIGLTFATIALSALTGCNDSNSAAETSSQGTASTNSAAEASEASGEKIKIGVSVQNLNAAFPLYTMAGVRNYAENEMPDKYEVTLLNADSKADLQVSQVETMIADGCAAIVINPVDKVGSAPCIQACVDAGIPVITVNTTVDNQELVTAHVGADDYIAGTLQMQAALELIGGTGKIGVLHGTLCIVPSLRESQ